MHNAQGNIVAEILGQLVFDYVARTNKGETECRVVLPGLTPAIAEHLHSILLTSLIPAYLVIPEGHSQSPDRNKRWLYAEALTTVRHGSMVVVVYPGEITKIHESMIGTGGAVRSLAFSDEWPWVDDGNEFFSFEVKFIEALLEKWGADSAERAPISTFLRKLVRDTSGNVERAKVVLEEILNSFVPNHSKSAPTILLQLLRHSGIPLPTALSSTDPNSLDTMWEDLGRFLSKVDARCSEDGARNSVLARCNELHPAWLPSVEALFNGMLGAPESASVGILATARGLVPSVWDALGEEELRRIFDLAPPQVDAKMEVSIDGSVLVSSDGLKSIITPDCNAAIEIRYEGIPIADVATYSIHLTQRTRTLGTSSCRADADCVSFPITLDALFPSGSFRNGRVALRVLLRRGDSVIQSKNIVVYPCFDEAPLILVANPGFIVKYGRAESDDAADPVKVNGEIDITVVIAAGAECTFEIDGESQVLVSDATRPHLLTPENKIDANSYPGGVVTIAGTHGDFVAEMELESTFAGRGEFTLEREFIFQVAGGSDSRVKRLADIFSGRLREHYGSLGTLADALPRAQVARRWEESGFGGRPIFANLANVRHRDVEERGLFGVIDCEPAGLAQSLTAASQQLVAEYEATRARLQSEVKAAFSPDPRWPAYAYYPLFVEQRAVDLERCVKEYLAAYSDIVKALPTLSKHVDWNQLTLLVYRDTVVDWRESGPNSLGVALLGPWHPLVVAKRFMVQRAVLGAARRRLLGSSIHKFHGLTRLLDQTAGFHWMHGLSSQDKTFKAVHASPTNDPGWHVAIEPTMLGAKHMPEIALQLSAWGLETPLFAGSLEMMAKSYIDGFAAAYPGRRAVTIKATRDYSAKHLVEAAASALYADDVSLTSLGHRLPGGIHLVVSQDENTLDFVSPGWRQPPVCLYVGSDEASRLDTHDINLLPPARVSAGLRQGDYPSIPRGEGPEAAFSVGLRSAVQAAGGSPTSALLEQEGQPRTSFSIGGDFRNTLTEIAKLLGQPSALFWDFHLPSALTYTWTVIPGNQADPAALAMYVRAGREAGQVRALWDYRMSIAGAGQSYFVVTLIPDIVRQSLNGSPVFQGKKLAEELLQQLGELGISIGRDSIRSARGAVGAVGVATAVRLLDRVRSAMPAACAPTTRQILLPIDSFRDVLTRNDKSEDGLSLERGDLLALRLVKDSPRANTRIYAVIVECKYLTHQMTEPYAREAAGQARASYDRLRALIDAARSSTGMPERLAFVALVAFGLRLAPTTLDEPSRLELDAALLRDLMNGDFELRQGTADVLVVSTEVALVTAESKDLGPRSLWVRTCPGHWPGANDTPQLVAIREVLQNLFGSSDVPVIRNNDQTQPATKKYVAGPAAVLSESAVDPLLRAVADPRLDSAVLPSKPDAPTPASPGTLEWRALIGATEVGKQVFLEAVASGIRLENRHIMVTGSSGKGKTQLIKSLVCQGRQAGANVLLLDFKNDFADDAVFIRNAGLQCHLVRFDGVPYNPLIPEPLRHPRTGAHVIQCAQHVSGIRDVLEKTFHVGDAQVGDLKDVILDSYREHGIDPTIDVVAREGQTFPDFGDIGRLLRDRNATAYRRLDRLFELGIFLPTAKVRRFSTLVQDSMILDLSQLPSDSVKNAIARIVVLSAHAFYNAQSHVGGLRQLLVFDEAHRILASPDLERFVREARAYGVGIVLASQNPSDFPPNIAASLSTKILHGGDRDRDRVRALQGLLGDSVAAETVSELRMFEAFISNAQHRGEKVWTYAYPHLLLHRFLLQTGPTNVASIRDVEGIDFRKSTLRELIAHLQALNLVRLRGEVVEALPIEPTV